MVWDCPGFTLVGVFMKDVDVGSKSLPIKLSDETGLSETSDFLQTKLSL